MAMFKGSEGEQIDPVTANRWISNYQNQEPFGVKAEFFGKGPMTELLNQSTAVAGFRIYYAKDDYEGWRLILVAVDGEGNNLGPIAGGKTGMLLQDGLPCPPFCPK
jgi:hypothetical protein